MNTPIRDCPVLSLLVTSVRAVSTLLAYEVIAGGTEFRVHSVGSVHFVNFNIPLLVDDVVFGRDYGRKLTLSHCTNMSLSEGYPHRLQYSHTS